MSFARYPEHYSSAERLRLNLTVRRAAQHAARVITITEFSKREIVHFLGVPEEKVVVTYLAAAPEFGPNERPGAVENALQRHSIRQPYLLAVGNISQRKNHRAAVAGFGRWCNRRTDSEHRLVLAGKPLDAIEDVLAEARKYGIEDRLQVLGYVQEEDLPCLYDGAEALLYTSIYEGFGLPIVEAMQSGTPVIASRASCFPEIVGDAGRLVEAEDADDIAQALDEILLSDEKRGEYVRRGVLRAKDFQWEKTARQTLKVYYEAAGGRPV